jgi:hypothetical protein
VQLEAGLGEPTVLHDPEEFETPEHVSANIGAVAERELSDASLLLMRQAFPQARIHGGPLLFAS